MSVEVFHKDLRAGVRQLLLTQTGLPSVSWEGAKFAPVVGQPYVSEVLQPISSRVMGTGRGGYIAHTVSAHFTLHYPADQGTVSIETLAGNLMQLFAPGTAVVYDEASAIVQFVERSGLRQDPDWVSTTVSANLVGHTTN